MARCFRLSEPIVRAPMSFKVWILTVVEQWLIYSIVVRITRNTKPNHPWIKKNQRFFESWKRLGGDFLWPPGGSVRPGEELDGFRRWSTIRRDDIGVPFDRNHQQRLDVFLHFFVGIGGGGGRRLGSETRSTGTRRRCQLVGFRVVGRSLVFIVFFNHFVPHSILWRSTSSKHRSLVNECAIKTTQKTLSRILNLQFTYSLILCCYWIDF